MEYTYKYPRPAVTADCVVMTNEPLPKVLLIQRGADPFKGAWAFPGGFMNMDETTEGDHSSSDWCILKCTP